MTTVLILKRVKGHTPIVGTITEVSDAQARDWIAKRWADEITPSDAAVARRVETTMLDRQCARGNGRCRA